MQPDRHARTARTAPDPRRRPDHGFRLGSRRRFDALLRDVVGTLPEPVASALHGAAVHAVAVPAGADPALEDVPLARVERRPGRSPVVVVYRRAVELRAMSAADVADLLRLAVVREAAEALGLDLGPEWDDPEA